MLVRIEITIGRSGIVVWKVGAAEVREVTIMSADDTGLARANFSGISMADTLAFVGIHRAIVIIGPTRLRHRQAEKGCG